MKNTGTCGFSPKEKRFGSNNFINSGLFGNREVVNGETKESELEQNSACSNIDIANL